MPSSCLSEAALSTAVADRASSPTDKPGPLTSVASVAAPRGIHQGVPAFLVTAAVALSLTIVFARVFASFFKTPFLRHRDLSPAALRLEPRAGELMA